MEKNTQLKLTSSLAGALLLLTACTGGDDGEGENTADLAENATDAAEEGNEAGTGESGDDAEGDAGEDRAGQDSADEAGAVPASATEHGGIVLTASDEIADGDGLTKLDPGSAPVSSGDFPEGLVEPQSGEPLQMVIYLDFSCPHCAQFEEDNGEQIQEWLDDGSITVEYRAVNFLDGSSGGYSSRAANAAACMAEESPENYFEFVGELLEEQGDAPETDELADLAGSHGAELEECIGNGQHGDFVDYTTEVAAENGVQGVPSVYLAGEDWRTSGQEFGAWAEGLISVHS